MAGRRNILKRRKNSLLIQSRDEEIVRVVYDYRFLSSWQIKNLSGFNSLKRANDRLRKLFDNGFLSRRIFINRSGKQLLYFLGPKAIEIISSKTQIDPSEIRRKRMKALKARDSFLSHFLFVNNFRYSLKMAVKKDSQAEIEAWRYKQVLFLAEEQKIFPDAYFRFRYSGETHNCFLEIDHSIESRERIRKKVEFYLDFGLFGDCERQLGFKYFRVLFVCKTLSRLKTILRIAERVSDKSFCWLTTEKNIVPERILTKIWLRPNREGVFSL